MSKVKIVAVGPCQTGKSTICNFLADASEISNGEYSPTQGVRILEFESGGGNGPIKQKTEVELWDCSGNQKFENCWPCIQRDTNGVLLVYNQSEQQHSKELETWHLHFVRQLNLNDWQCLVFNHTKPTADEAVRAKLSSTFSKVQVVECNLDEDPESIRRSFAKFVAQIARKLEDKRDAEELSIVS